MDIHVKKQPRKQENHCRSLSSTSARRVTGEKHVTKVDQIAGDLGPRSEQTVTFIQDLKPQMQKEIEYRWIRQLEKEM